MSINYIIFRHHVHFIEHILSKFIHLYVVNRMDWGGILPFVDFIT